MEWHRFCILVACWRAELERARAVGIPVFPPFPAFLRDFAIQPILTNPSAEVNFCLLA